MPSPRFTIDLYPETDPPAWHAAVYDHADHGSEMPYAECWGGTLEKVLESASHYVLMAEPEPPLSKLTASIPRNHGPNRD